MEYVKSGITGSEIRKMASSFMIDLTSVYYVPDSLTDIGGIKKDAIDDGFIYRFTEKCMGDIRLIHRISTVIENRPIISGPGKMDMDGRYAIDLRKKDGSILLYIILSADLKKGCYRIGSYFEEGVINKYIAQWMMEFAKRHFSSGGV